MKFYRSQSVLKSRASRRIMRIFLTSLVIFLSSLFPLFASDTAPTTVRVGVDPNYPPFSEIDTQGQLRGFDIDIALALCSKMKVECEFVTMNWSELISALQADTIDAIISSISITEARRQWVDFTDRYYSNVVRFVAHRDSNFNPESPQGSTIGVAPGTVSFDWLEDNWSEIVNIVPYTDFSTILKALDDGEVDAIFGDGLGYWNWLQSLEGADFAFVGEGRHVDEGIGIAVRKGEDQLRDNFNQGIQAILDDGTYDEINAKYFPFSIY